MIHVRKYFEAYKLKWFVVIIDIFSNALYKVYNENNERVLSKICEYIQKGNKYKHLMRLFIDIFHKTINNIAIFDNRIAIYEEPVRKLFVKIHLYEESYRIRGG